MWWHDGLSEDNLDIEYREPEGQAPTTIEGDNSDNRPLRLQSPRKIKPSEIQFTLGDKTTMTIVNKCDVAHKGIVRKTKRTKTKTCTTLEHN